MDNIIVRETMLINTDALHKHNIYIPFKNGFINVYTCIHCKDVFAQFIGYIEEPDTNVNIKDVPLKVLRHWCAYLVNVNGRLHKVAYSYLREYLDNNFPSEK